MKQNKSVRGKKKAAPRRIISLMAMVDEKEKASEADERFFRLYKPRKVAITIRLDADVVMWFRQTGRKYQTRINQVLRRVMEAEAGED